MIHLPTKLVCLRCLFSSYIYTFMSLSASSLILMLLSVQHIIVESTSIGIYPDNTSIYPPPLFSFRNYSNNHFVQQFRYVRLLTMIIFFFPLSLQYSVIHPCTASFGFVFTYILHPNTLSPERLHGLRRLMSFVFICASYSVALLNPSVFPPS